MRYELTGENIKDTETSEELTYFELLNKIANDIEELKEQLK